MAENKKVTTHNSLKFCMKIAKIILRCQKSKSGLFWGIEMGPAPLYSLDRGPALNLGVVVRDTDLAESPSLYNGGAQVVSGCVLSPTANVYKPNNAG